MNSEPIAYPKDEREDFYSDDDLFKISSWGADLSFRELIDRYENEELLKPALQRKYVWDKVEASRFIDSLLLGLPVPSIFLSKQPDEKLLIIDGYQRIMTVYDYVKKGIFTGDGKVFKLTKSEKINQRWRGKAFSELSEDQQRKIRNTTIHAIVFVQQHPDDNDTSLYQIFERINTSGRSLLPQEIRNCIYESNFNDMLMEVNRHESWRTLFGSSVEDNRMRDVELILRFYALNPIELDKINIDRISLKKHLNTCMGGYSHLCEKEINACRDEFIRTSDFLLKCFGEKAFHSITDTETLKMGSRLSPTVYDSIAIAASIYLKKNPNAKPIAGIQKRKGILFEDSEYKDAITTGTTRTKAIYYRINRACEVLFSMGN